ncbi:MAG: aminoglycoside phosphotransferase family protein [Desulfobulbaceae bacterium]|nr:aminoglycoside phosphotransferase family protein [Desulfobulbaceae bacterium]
MKPELQAALFFLPEEDIAAINILGAGNINDTFTVNLHSGERRILQRLNPSVFHEPRAVMHNMRTVLDHLDKELEKDSGGRENFRLPSLFRGKSGEWFEAEDGSIWRLMSMVEDSTTCSRISDPGQARELGRGLGLFHRLLRNLDPEQLFDTLPDIHNTSNYLDAFDRIFYRRGKPAGAAAEYCSAFIEQHRHRVLIPADRRAGLTRGVIHGDPKVDNFLFAAGSHKVISLIDLDTVKPGLLLHDLGDALRSCCNVGGETAVQPEHIFFAPELFHAWLTGYFSHAGFLLADSDLEHIVAFVRLITFELGLRFHTDYVGGNRYFKVRFPEENLQRALVQFYLAESIEKQWDHLQSLVRKAAGTH